MKNGQYSIIVRTPFRITLGGGGTDVFWYSRLHGGAWISAAVNKYIYVAVKKSRVPKITINGLPIPPHGNKVVLECLKFVKVKDSLDVAITSEVLPSSGLGGSGTLEVGLLHALYAYKNVQVSKMRLAKEATFIETDKLNMPVGPQDQLIAAFGGCNAFTINTKGKIFIEPLLLSSLTKRTLQRNLIYFSTDILKDTSKILDDEKRQLRHLNSSDRLIKELDNLKKIGYLAKEYLISGKSDEFGKLLHVHWMYKKNLSAMISNSVIDRWYKEAIKAGALGGKIMGAGGGGWFIFYINKNKNKFRKKMSSLGLQEQKLSFDWSGTKVISA